MSKRIDPDDMVIPSYIATGFSCTFGISVLLNIIFPALSVYLNLLFSILIGACFGFHEWKARKKRIITQKTEIVSKKTEDTQ